MDSVEDSSVKDSGVDSGEDSSVDDSGLDSEMISRSDLLWKIIITRCWMDSGKDFSVKGWS